MMPRRTRKLPPLLYLICLAALASGPVGCGEDDGPTPPLDVDPGGGDGDVITLAVNGGAAVRFAEASGLPGIDCDPRVDWSSYQVILWNDFTGGGGPSGYDHFFEIMFPVNDDVGTYEVQADFVQAMYYAGGHYYFASPSTEASSGTVAVTRSDDRIEGSYELVLVDADGVAFIELAGTFDVERGFSLSCP